MVKSTVNPGAVNFNWYSQQWGYNYFQNSGDKLVREKVIKVFQKKMLLFGDRLRHNPFASIVNSFSTGYGLTSNFQYWESEFYCTCAVNTRIIITFYKQTARVIILKSTQNKTNHFEWLWKVCMVFVIQNDSKFMRLFIMISRGFH